MLYKKNLFKFAEYYKNKKKYDSFDAFYVF